MNRNLVGAFVLVAGGFGLAADAPAAYAKDIRVGRDAKSLERALARANPGDRIIVRGVVRSDVTITTPGVTIVFRSGGFAGDVNIAADGVTIERARFRKASLTATGDGTTIDGSRFLQAPATFVGENVTLTDNTFEGAWYADGLVVSGDGALVSGNDLSNFTGAVEVTGDGAVVTENTVDGAITGIVVTGNDAVVGGNEITTVQDSGIVVVGTGADVGANTVTGGADEPAIAVIGGGAELTGNLITDVTAGAFVEGDGAVVSGNVIGAGLGTDTALVVIGDGTTVSGNEVTTDFYVYSGTGLGDAIGVYGDGTTVVGNDVSGYLQSGAGIRVEGDTNLIGGNDVHDTSGAYAIVVSGTDNDTTENTVENVDGEGVIVDGTGNTVTDTTVADVSSCGVLLYGATKVERTTATRCGMGVVNFAQGTTIVDSKMNTNGPYDLIDLGRVTSTAGSQVGTVERNSWSFPALQDMRRAGYHRAQRPTWDGLGGGTRPGMMNW